MSGELIPADAPDPGRSLHPNRVAIWPVEVGGYGIDFGPLPRDEMRAVLDRFAW